MAEYDCYNDTHPEPAGSIMKHVCIAVPVIILIFLCLSSTPINSQAADRKLLIGLIPEMNIFKQKQRFKPLGEYLSKKTGTKIGFTIVSRYENIIENFGKEKMDGAFLGSFTGYAGIHKLGLMPIARPVNLDNTSEYQGYIFVRRDGHIRDVKDMKGKKMAFVDKATTAGYVFPLAYFKEHGVASYEHFLKEYYFAGSHDAAIEAVLNGKADIGAAKHSIYNRVRKENPRIDRELVILARSPWVPENGLCVRKNLDDIIVKKLKDALLNMHNDAEGRNILKEFQAIKFIAATAKDYEPVHELAAKAGIKIKEYNWHNK